ncbi:MULTISPECIES: class A beta-lactamase [unclassified Bradyrhizobium]|uniref:class A beta-lactamase n=1 Tax=Bradyrhizobium TaxID=374 RepID=UPI002915C7B5|nr:MULTISPECIES: class A beta-lactamase [unclassified Bradyrhizobium]
MLTRRHLGFGILGMAAAASGLPSPAAKAAADRRAHLEGELARIERESLGRLGIAVLDSESGFEAGLRSAERFPMCSTFKCLASAAVLKRVDAGELHLDTRVPFEAKDLVTYSPVTKEHVGRGMTLAELCEAALTQSDNTAGNLLLRQIGGPAGLTRFARSIGDEISRLDRWEIELNEALADDPRDTTSPAAMLQNLRRVLLGEVLSTNMRQRLTDWMIANKTGDTRLRAGVPRDWRVADKTGAGDRGTTNDIGILWPPGRKPVLVTAYLTGSQASPEDRNATIAKVARAVADVVMGQAG